MSTAARPPALPQAVPAWLGTGAAPWAAPGGDAHGRTVAQLFPPHARLPVVPTAPGASRIERAWVVLHSLPDPEVPAVSVCDLGIVREVNEQGDALDVVVTPTYSGCPATELIAGQITRLLEDEGLGPVRVTQRRSPAWTTDWLSEQGRERLRAYGIAPPGAAATAAGEAVVHLIARGVACPRCGSPQTERLSAFGSTPCKALYRCLACREPFDHMKAI